ncbi:hypothetical protein NJB1907f44_29010 [Mycobacterium marinum]|nr:hypothetical protein NJB1907E90_34220 [Mycobacterium marinum]GJO26752.1 hypothetical protein NJB1907f22_16940 [Mycobacterium marinum]GJO29892.1 hypothetical protein NJB1907E11_50330 [Mycobacterium marinum]GJO40919.1 hypothetical protein NJB1907E19_28400 [Mycobacterium marinum]GJO47484.1 hypothetical protein NJB1907f3_17930 [Mycobacterium marinum]
MNSWLPGLTTLSPEIESVLAWRDPACRLAVDAAAELHNAYPIVGRAVSQGAGVVDQPARELGN